MAVRGSIIQTLSRLFPHSVLLVQQTHLLLVPQQTVASLTQPQKVYPELPTLVDFTLNQTSCHCRVLLSHYASLGSYAFFVENRTSPMLN